MRVPELELELEFEFNATAELELELVNSSVALLGIAGAYALAALVVAARAYSTS